MLKYYNRIYKYTLSMFLATTFTTEWQMIILNSKSKYTEGVAHIQNDACLYVLILGQVWTYAIII